MSLFSENDPDQAVKQLEKILLEGIKTNSQDVIDFVRAQFYLDYLTATEYSYGAYEIPLEIKRVYED